MNKKTIKRLVGLILFLVLAYFAGFYLAPYLQARWLFYKMEKTSRESTQAITSLVADAKESMNAEFGKMNEDLQKSLNPESSPAAESQAAVPVKPKSIQQLEEARDKVNELKNQSEKLLAPYMLVFSEPAFLKFLQEAHVPPHSPKTTYCFFAPPPAPSLDEVQQWLNTVDAEDVYSKIDKSLEDSVAYEEKFHHGDKFSAYADYLKQSHPNILQPKLLYRAHFYGYVDQIRKAKLKQKPLDAEMEQFLEENSRFVSNRPAFFGIVIPQVLRKIFEKDAVEILQGFQLMIASVGACEDVSNMGIQDLVARNECYRHADKWVGSYVSEAMAKKIQETKGSLYSLNVSSSKMPESMKYSLEIFSYDDESNRKTLDVLVGLNDVGLPTWLKACGNVHYNSVKRSFSTPPLNLIEAKGAAWSEIPAECAARLWDEVKIGKLANGMIGFQFPTIVPTWFWDNLSLKSDEWVVKVNGKLLDFATMGELKQNTKWLAKEGIQIEVISNQNLLSPAEKETKNPKKNLIKSK